MWPLLVLWWGHGMFISLLREDYKLTELPSEEPLGRRGRAEALTHISFLRGCHLLAESLLSHLSLSRQLSLSVPPWEGGLVPLLRKNDKMYGIRFLQFAVFLQELCAYQTSFKEDVHFSKQSWGLAVVALSLFWISTHYPMLWCFFSLDGSVFEW